VYKRQDLGGGGKIEYYRERFVKKSAEGEEIAQYINTTVGRIIYNKTVQEALSAAV
jgi:DNA-directed RNA polymerase subunit beta'